VFLSGLALLLLMFSENQIPGQERVFALPAKMIGGLGRCLSASAVLPPLISPGITLEGTVTDFHEVTSFDASPFEFKLNSKGHLGSVLRAHYFDKGFYFGDPEVSDGDVIKVSYFTWTNDVFAINKTSGHHPGWSYREDNAGVGPWLLGALGVFLFLSGIVGWLTDRVAQPNAAEA
jgi:hypothetical protein